MEEKNIQNQQQVPLLTFIKISILLCLTNITIIGRLHMYDQASITAQHYYNSDLPMIGGNPHQRFATPKINKDSNFLSLFTEIELQSSYLLPIILSISTLFILLRFTKFTNIYKNLINSLLTNIICFILLWQQSDNFVVYRLTYIVQGFVIFPMLINCSYGIIRIIPKQIQSYKVYYICLMFVIPYIGIPISYLVFDGYPYDKSPTDILQSALFGTNIFGFVVCTITIIVIYMNKDSINNSVQVSAQLFAIPQNQPLQQQQQSNKQQITISQQISNRKQKPYQNKKKQLTRKQINTMLIYWGIMIAISNQLSQLKKYLLAAINLSKQNIQVQKILTKTTADVELTIIIFVIILSVFVISMIYDRQIRIIQATIIGTTIGYIMLMVLFIVDNNIGFSINLEIIHACMLISKTFMMAIVLPIVFIEEYGLNPVPAIAVLGAATWGFELGLRLWLLMLDNSMKLFVLAFVALLSCYVAATIGKEFEQQQQQVQQIGQVIQQAKVNPKIPTKQQNIAYPQKINKEIDNKINQTASTSTQTSSTNIYNNLLANQGEQSQKLPVQSVEQQA